MKLGSVTVVWGRQWSCSVDATSNDGLTIPKSFDGNSGKPKKMNAAIKTPRKTKIALKYTVRTENYGHRKVALIPCQIFALIHHVEYASMDAETKA